MTSRTPLTIPARLVHTLVLLPALVSACGDKPPAPAAAPRPVLERPSTKLATDPKRLRIPQKALVERGGIPGVFVLSGEKQARFRMIKTGKRIGSEIEVLSGLSGGETLVLGDLTQIHDGSPIKTQETTDEHR